MAFGSQMHHNIGLVLGKDGVQRRAIADIGLGERIKRAVCNAGHVLKTGGIGQCIEVHDRVPLPHGLPHDG